MLESIRPQIERLHATPHKTVLAVSGAGAQAVAWLLGVSGASRTILEVVVPYGRLSMQDFLGFEPAQSAAAETARQLARRAWQRARAQLEDDSPPVGLACAATIATDRPKRGDHRAFVSAWDEQASATWSLTFHKGLRDRAGEEQIVSLLIVQALSEFSGLDPELDLGLTPGDTLEIERADRPGPLEQLLSGEAHWLVRGPGGRLEIEGEAPGVLLPGSFNPMHVGHREMMAAATGRTGGSGGYELSVTNVDKPPLEVAEIERRLAQFGPEDTIVLTRAETFWKKAQLFPGRSFLLGWDTAVRLVAPRYYGGETRMLLALAEMMASGTNFLIAGRAESRSFRTLADVDVPAGFAPMFSAISESEFRRDISSTELRQAYKEGEMEIREPTVLINVYRSLREGRDPYDAVRWAWKVNINRIRQYNLVLAHDSGKVVGAFRPIEWAPATRENFPGLRTDEPDRWGFVGVRAEPDAWNLYVGKRLANHQRGQNPVRYCDP